MERTKGLRDILTAGLIAGLAGGILIEAFLYGTQLLRGFPPSVIIDDLRFVAVAAVGPAASGGPAGAIVLGLVVHFCVAIGWAIGYANLMRSQPQLIALPWISGAAFGLVVYVFMGIVELTAGMYHRPEPMQLLVDLIAHLGFYGIPVALIASRLMRAPAALNARA